MTGRPKKSSNGEHLSGWLRVRLTPELESKIDRLARAQGQTRSDYVRDVLEKKAS